MMGLSVVCCKKCFAALQAVHPQIAEAWADICAEYVLQGLKPIKWGIECEAISQMENGGYIVSHENLVKGRKLIVKPLGRHDLQDQHFFCIDFENHLVQK